MASDESFAELFKAVSGEVRSWFNYDEARRTHAFERVNALDRHDQAAFVVYCLHRTADLGEYVDEINTEGPLGDKEWPKKQRRLYVWWAAVSSAHALLRRSLPWTDEQLGALIAHFEAPIRRSGIERHVAEGQLERLDPLDHRERRV